jgi:hypothetical protein
MKTYHVYVLPPVDIGWGMFKTVRQVIDIACDDIKKRAADNFENLLYHGRGVYRSEVDISDFLENYDQSLRAAKKTGWWEGDMRHEPVVVPLVRELEGEYGFMWKQDNNGTTFVVTSEEMPHYAQFAMEYRAVSAQ